MQKQIIELTLKGFGLAELVAKGVVTQQDADQIEADAGDEIRDLIAAQANLVKHRYVIRTGDTIDDL
jgi:hypothetical protein